MKKCTLLHFTSGSLLLTLFFAVRVYGQTYYNQTMEYINANSVWAVASGGGLNFNTASPNIVATASNMSGGGEGGASVADALTGELLFYSDGERVWNAGHEVMLNGDSLLGNSLFSYPLFYGYGNGGSATQGVCILPFINQPGKYYLFSLNGPTNWFLDGPPDAPFLYYSVIDMSLDGGLGAVVPGQKNIPLGENIPLSESMIAIPGDNCDVWLIVHDYMNPVFSAYHISSGGVDPDPVISITGEQIQGAGGLGAYYMGGMAVAPNRQVLGISSFSWSSAGSGVLLCRFNPATGAVSDAIQFDQGLMPYTLAFSPDNTKLYLGNVDPNFLLPTSLLQYDIGILDSATITVSKEVIQELNGSLLYLKSYKGKIYILSGQVFMDPSGSGGFVSLITIVNEPNLPGTACNAQDTMLSTYLGVCLPNEVVYAFPPDTLSMKEDTTICVKNGEYDHINLTAPEGYAGYEWDDGNEEETRAINAPGVYRVLCKDSCHSLLDSFIVQAVDIPLDLGEDTLLCNGELLTMDVSVPAGSYLWQDSSTGSRYSTAASGLYWVRVTASGCTVSDTLQVTTIDLRQELGDDIILCKGESLQAPVILTAHVPAGSEAIWSNGSNDTSLSVEDTGVYWVIVTAATCMGSDTLRIGEELCECRLSLPNAFSPNGDGKNDVFKPVIENGCPVQGYVLTIYNRYGNRVYSGYHVDEGWNGYYGNGRQADVGTYMYEVKFTGGTKQIPYYYKGDITLIR